MPPAVVVSWLLVAVYGITGLITLISPNTWRTFIKRFLTPTPVRVFGVVLMVVGGAYFARSGDTNLPVFAKLMAVWFFVTGGVQLVLPMVPIVVSEWWIDRRNLWYRAYGLVCFGLAYGFFVASRVPAVEEAVTSAGP